MKSDLEHFIDNVVIYLKACEAEDNCKIDQIEYIEFEYFIKWLEKEDPDFITIAISFEDDFSQIKTEYIKVKVAEKEYSSKSNKVIIEDFFKIRS